MRLSHRPALASASACLLALAGCATVRAAAGRDAYLESQLGSYRFGESCDQLWPNALRVVDRRGFPVVGDDRHLIGESPEGILSSLVSDGFSTRRTDEGGLVAETNWNQNVGTRYRVEGKPDEPKGCRVTYLLITGGAQGDTQLTVGPDWEMLLDLVGAVDPGTADRIEAGAHKG